MVKWLFNSVCSIPAMAVLVYYVVSFLCAHGYKESITAGRAWWLLEALHVHLASCAAGM